MSKITREGSQRIIIELELEGDTDGELARDWAAWYLDGGGEQEFYDTIKANGVIGKDEYDRGGTTSIRIVKREEENADETVWKWK